MSSTRDSASMISAVRFHAGGTIRVDQLRRPTVPPGGLLVRTIACGLCSGELMTWYMERKAERDPHVLGHEVVGEVIESDNPNYPVGTQVSPHHHAPCMHCERCMRGAFVHCETWRKTRLDPGGMAEIFAVSAANLADCPVSTGLDIWSASLVEPLACVAKQLRRVGYKEGERAAVVGLGSMGLMHALVMPGSVGFDLSQPRLDWAIRQGVDARRGREAGKFTCIIVCPGSKSALDFAMEIADVDARVGLFAPLPPGEAEFDFERAYMKDISLINSYSCGPEDTRMALKWLRAGSVRGDQIYEEVVPISGVPEAYARMKSGSVLKVGVKF